MKLSQSALGTFIECPYSYYLHYIEKEPPVFFEPQYLDAGSMTHKVIEKYYNIYPPIEAIPGIINRLYKEYKDVYRLEPEFNKRCHIALTNFANYEIYSRKRGRARPKSEWYLSVEDGNVTYHGYIDYYNPVTQKIMDFKVAKENMHAGLKLQAAFYILMVRKKLDIEARFYDYFLLSNIIRPVEINHELEDKLERTKNDILTAIDKNHFPATGNCKYCNYRWCCDKKKE